MNKRQKDERHVILCCMILAMFGIVNLTMYYNTPTAKVFWQNKRLETVEVDNRLQVDVQAFCKALNLDYQLEGNQLIFDGVSAQMVSLDTSASHHYNVCKSDEPHPITVWHGRAPLEKLCQILGIPFSWDEAQNIICLGENIGGAKSVPVLMYHHILPQADVQGIFADNDLVITLEDFKRQMAYLRDNGYHSVSLQRLESYVKGEGLLPEKSVVITFDDGYLSNLVYAYPVLKEMGFTGVIFLLTGYVEEEAQDFSPEALQYLSWPDVRQMEDVFQFASHTHDLHRLSKRGKGILTEIGANEIISDLSLSRKMLRQTPYLAYPYGHYSKLAVDTLQKQGITMAFTVNQASVKMGDDPMRLSRWDAVRYRDLEKFANILE